MNSLTSKEELGLRGCVLFSDFQFYPHLTSYILLMSELFVACDSFESNCKLIDEIDLTEEELRDHVSNILLKIKNQYVNN